MGKIELDHTGSGGGITLSSDGTDLLLNGTAVGGGGGSALELYAENPSTPTAPSATGTNAVAIGNTTTASGNESITAGPFSSATAYGASAFGTLAIAAGAYSVALGKGRAGGGTSLSAIIDSTSSSYGATAANSIAMGYQAKATGLKSIAIGDVATASSTSAVAIGDGPTASASDAMAIGESCVAGFTRSMAFGTRSTTRAIGQFVYGTGSLVSGGYAQYGNIVIHGRSADATQGALVSDSSLQAMGTAGSSNQLSVPSYGAIAFDGMIVARGQGSASDTDCAAWKVEGLIRRESAVSTTTLVNSAITVIDNQPNWSISLSADTTNGCLSVLVTGAASQNVKWVCTLRSTETVYNSY